ncbi:MAG: hypothetical protein ACI9LO_003490, partial [Planctomycetota bacterium]
RVVHAEHVISENRTESRSIEIDFGQTALCYWSDREFSSSHEPSINFIVGKSILAEGGRSCIGENEPVGSIWPGCSWVVPSPGSSNGQYHL